MITDPSTVTHCACTLRRGMRCARYRVLERAEATARLDYDRTDAGDARLAWIRARNAVRAHGRPR